MQRDKVQITRALNVLIAGDLIVSADNPLDRRSHLLKPTSEGEKVMAKLDAIEASAVERLTVNLKNHELEFFLRLSQTMADSGEQISADDEGEA